MCSRRITLVLGVGRGGKTLFGEQSFEIFVEGRLVAFDRHQIISPTLEKYFLRGLVMGVQRVSQDNFANQILFGQNQAHGGNLIGFGWGHDTAQKPALRVHRVDDLDPGMADFLAIDDDDLVLRRAQDLTLPP